MGEEDLKGPELKPEKSRFQTLLKTIAIVGGLMLLAFLIGLVPIWIREHRLSNDYDAAQHDLKLNQWQNALGGAAIDARRGEYEAARQSASKFFSEVSAELTKTSDSVFTTQQIDQVKGAMGPRDEIITLLARNDPASADKLTAMYLAFRAAVATPAAAK